MAGCAGGGTKVDSGGKVGIPDSKFANSSADAKVAVDVIDNEFDKPYLIVTVGTRVTWTNHGRNDHTVTPVKEGAFEGVAKSDFSPGQTHSYTFGAVGDYPYYCSIHGTAKLNGQAGVIRVVAKK